MNEMVGTPIEKGRRPNPINNTTLCQSAKFNKTR